MSSQGVRELWDLESAAQQLSVSPWTLRKHVKQGSLRCVRVGNRVLIPTTELGRICAEGLPSLSTKK